MDAVLSDEDTDAFVIHDRSDGMVVCGSASGISHTTETLDLQTLLAAAGILYKKLDHGEFLEKEDTHDVIAALGEYRALFVDIDPQGTVTAYPMVISVN